MKRKKPPRAFFLPDNPRKKADRKAARAANFVMEIVRRDGESDEAFEAAFVKGITDALLWGRSGKERRKP